MKKIIYSEIIKHRNLNFANKVYSSVSFVNSMIEVLDAKEIALQYVSEILFKWMDNGSDDEILPMPVILKYLERVPSECIPSRMDVEDVVGFWLSYCIGECSNGITEPEKLYRILMHMFYSYDGRGFVYSYELTPAVVSSIVPFVDYSVESIVKRSRYATGEDVDEYISFFKNMTFQQKKGTISKEYFYKDFNPLPEDCFLLSIYFVRTKMYKEWADIFLSIPIPFLQVQMVTPIQNACDILQLYNELASRPDGEQEELSRIILMNEWMLALVREQTMNITPLPIDDYDEEVIKSYVENQKDFNKEASGLAKKGAAMIIKAEGAKRASEWAFSKNKAQEDMNERNIARNLILGYIQEEIAQALVIDDINLNAKDLHYLAFLCNQFASQNIKDERRIKLLDSVWKSIESPEFFWPSSLDSQTMSDMRSISRLIAHEVKRDLLDKIIDRFFVLYEGVGAVHMKDWGNMAKRESYVYCILLLITEFDNISMDDRNDLFMHVTDRMINQARCCGMDLLVEHDYLMPLILAECIADQLLTSVKEAYESHLAEAIYSKEVVMKVLSFAKSGISAHALGVINKFKDTDWNIIRKDFLHRKMKDRVQEIENLFVRLLNANQ